jgi:hypothetical protein
MPRKTLTSDIKNSLNSSISKNINDNIHIQGMCSHSTMLNLDCDIENSKFVINECACPLIYSSNPEECNKPDAKCGPTDFSNNIDYKKIQKQQQELMSSISQRTGIKFLPGSYTAKNSAIASLNAVTGINNALYQDCVSVQDSMNIIDCRNSNLNNVYISQNDNSITDVINCVTSQDYYDTAVQDLHSTISQMEEVDSPGWLYTMYGLLVLLTFVGFTLILTLNYSFWFVRFPLSLFFIIILIYLFSWVTKKFGKKTNTVKSYCADCSKYDNQMDCNNALCVWDEDGTPPCLCDGTKLNCTTQCPNFLTKKTCIKNNCGWDPTTNVCTGKPPTCITPPAY